jgi:hypothetical protein
MPALSNCRAKEALRAAAVGGRRDDREFVSEAIGNIPAGYRARETYTILSRDEFTERAFPFSRSATRIS